MAKVRLAAPILLPSWPPSSYLAGSTAPALTAPQAIAAANDRLIVNGRVRWADGAAHDLHQIIWRSLTAAPTATVRVGPRDIDTANGPPARDDGNVDQSGTHANPASNTNFTTTLDTDRVAVAHGSLLTIVWDFSAYTSGSVQIAGLPGTTTTAMHRPHCTYYNGSVYAIATNGRVPVFTLVAADGTFGIFEGNLPAISAAVAAVTWNSGSNPLERGILLTPSAPFWVAELAAFIRTVAGGDFDIVLYEGTTEKARVSVDSNTWAADASGGMFFSAIADYAAVIGNDVHLVIAPTTGTSVTIYTLTFASAGEAKLITGMAGGYGTRNGGAWTDVATQLPFWFLVGVIGIDDALTKNLLVTPGMSGGIRG